MLLSQRSVPKLLQELNQGMRAGRSCEERVNDDERSVVARQGRKSNQMRRIAACSVLAGLVGKDEGKVLGRAVAGLTHGHLQGKLQQDSMQLDE